MEHAVSENTYAGYAMSRRAAYQYGGYLDKGPQGSLAMGIGNGQSAGKTSFIRPTYEVATSGEWLTIDGVRMQFQLMPGTEAPAEMNTWIPERRALWVAENCTGTLHNLYTLRGAQVRDGNAWAKYITEAVALYGSEVEVTFQSHNWPHWGNAAVNDYMVNTAAIYKFINDQAPSMLNNGKVSAEIAHEITLPAALEQSAPATRCALCAAPNMASLTRPTTPTACGRLRPSPPQPRPRATRHTGTALIAGGVSSTKRVLRRFPRKHRCAQTCRHEGYRSRQAC